MIKIEDIVSNSLPNKHFFNLQFRTGRFIGMWLLEPRQSKLYFNISCLLYNIFGQLFYCSNHYNNLTELVDVLAPCLIQSLNLCKVIVVAWKIHLYREILTKLHEYYERGKLIQFKNIHFFF